ncbi:MAG: DUF547 domain-containing protein [Planctomycetota bacterium]|jgi:hypothetical protein
MRSICKLSTLAALLAILTILPPYASAVDTNDTGFRYDDYAAALKRHVDKTGMVNYRQLKAEPQQLQSFVAVLAALDANTYEKWSKKEQIAFWLNVYNGLTLKVIIDNYPIKSSFFRSRVYPKNSIRQIAGVWDKITFDVMSRKLTLGQIEHEILRKKFDEPRIHVAMVCAAMSCPPLRNEPYIGQKLDGQLADQSKKFLANPRSFRADHEKTLLYLSPILKWFAEDFVNKHAPEKNIGRHKRKTSAVLNFIAAYLPESEANFVLKGNYKIKYLKYDWSLNEQKPTGDKKAK